MNRFFYIFFISTFLFFSCTNNNEEDYFSDFNCDWVNTDFSLFLPDPDCNLVNLSYQSNIASIIDSKCAGCHNESSSHGINLTTYSNLLSYDICFQIDNNLMPPSWLPNLSDCEKLQIKTWIENGMVE